MNKALKDITANLSAAEIKARKLLADAPVNSRAATHLAALVGDIGEALTNARSLEADRPHSSNPPRATGVQHF